MKPVAICTSLLSRTRKDFSTIMTWEEWLNEQHIPFEYLDCYASDIIGRLENYSMLLWHYSNFVNADLMEAQHILDIAAQKGLLVFPNHATGWHFDDKIAETYAFQAVGAPIPRNWVFYEHDTCIQWLEWEAGYPIVAKLRRGSGSNNVKLLHNFAEAKRYANHMFTRGYSPAQSLIYKTYSKVQSTRDWKTFVNRAKQVPNFLKARRFGKGMPDEKGYCYFQEFIPNDGYDIKVAVVGDKCTFLSRSVRKGDFKASGSGDIRYDRSIVSDNVIRSAFKTADALKMQCVGFDYVVDKSSGKGLIIEMCFGFDFQALYDCGGYWDRDLKWHDEPLNVPCEVVSLMVKELTERESRGGEQE